MNVAFDHLMVMVADEAMAAQEFSKAGFAVTPRSELPGMANRLVCFPSSAGLLPAFLNSCLSNGQKKYLLAFGVLSGRGSGPWLSC